MTAEIAGLQGSRRVMMRGIGGWSTIRRHRLGQSRSDGGGN